MTADTRWPLTDDERLMLARCPAGAAVRFRRKGDVLWEAGVVRFWLACLDEPAARVVTADGGAMDVMPGLGDELELIGR
jgi:hypothetical protein